MLNFLKLLREQKKAQETVSPTNAPSAKSEKQQRQEYWAKIYTLILFLKHQDAKKRVAPARETPLFMQNALGSKKLPEKERATRRYLALKFSERIR